jgi:hypothetical protein
MRRGNDPMLVFSKSGNLVAIATGADACAEHECGSKPLLEALCVQPANDAKIIAELKAGKTVTYPDLLESKRITRFPASLQWIEAAEAGREPEACFGLANSPIDFTRHELELFDRFSGTRDKDVAGAWDEGSFAIRVRGQKYVAALREFYKALRDGKVAFAGLFFKRDPLHLSGVILADTRYLSDEDRQAIAVAQKKHEASLRLKARSEADMLMYQLSQKLRGTHIGGIGFLWPIWGDANESTVVYALNPGYQVNASYYGPYTKEELLAWGEAKGAYRLVPKRQAA